MTVSSEIGDQLHVHSQECESASLSRMLSSSMMTTTSTVDQTFKNNFLSTDHLSARGQQGGEDSSVGSGGGGGGGGGGVGGGGGSGAPSTSKGKGTGH